MTRGVLQIRPRKSGGRRGRRGPSEDEGGAGVRRMRDEKESDERFHPLVEISRSPSLPIAGRSRTAKVFQECLRLFGDPANIIVAKELLAVRSEWILNIESPFEHPLPPVHGLPDNVHRSDDKDNDRVR